LMWDRGVLWHPGCVNIMYAHTPEQIDTVIAAAADSLEAMP
jgi:glutamate-1-semialdehyde aminotransferase